MERGAPPKLFERLADALEMPVVSCVAGWRHDLAVDLDELAARHLIERIEAVAEDGPVALFLAGRGGTLGFADLVRRTARRVELHVVIPYLSTGRVALAAVSGAMLRVGRYGAIGAFDAPCANVSIPVDSGAALGLARRVLDDDPAALSVAALGSEGGLAGDEIAALLGRCVVAVEPAADAIAWELFQAYESALGLLESPTPRYEESEVGDEVEWEFAVGVPGAFIESDDVSRVYLLDTGKPDPDTGRLDGEWALPGRDEVLELDFDRATKA
jgi:hypothetical protein